MFSLIIKRNFPRIDKEDCVDFRPHMKCKAWSPHLVKDTETLQKVQRRATKCVTGMKGKT